MWRSSAGRIEIGGVKMNGYQKKVSNAGAQFVPADKPAGKAKQPQVKKGGDLRSGKDARQ